MAGRFPFPGLPNGWYVVAMSDELRPGQLITRRYFDRELVVYRGKSGEVRIVDAFCPHMGAHLGKVGSVEGDLLRCGFHGFEYDGEGRCVATPYDGPPPAKARVAGWPVREQNGLILTWFDATGAAPHWEVPVLDDERWNKPRWHRFQIATHPQETTENSVDFGHFTQLHGFVDGSVTQPLKIEGPLLTSSYRAWRGLPTPKYNFTKVPVDYAVKVWGLGYSQVDVRLDTFHMDLRIWVLPIPIDEEHIHLIIGASTPKHMGPFAPLARYIGHRIVCAEVGQDLDVWTYKTYVEKPALAKGDGPVAEYRRYVKQFYTSQEEERQSA